VALIYFNLTIQRILWALCFNQTKTSFNNMEQYHLTDKRTKQKLRKYYFTKRLALSTKEHKKRSHQIANLFTYNFPPSTIRSLHTYVPIPSKREPDTTLIIDKLNKLNKHMPIINPTKDDPNSHAHVVTQLPTQFRPSHIIVPLLAVDPSGQRIGFGAGYYDIFLSHFPKSTIKIGLSLFDIHPKLFQAEPHDIRLDYVITPNQVYKIKQTNNTLLCEPLLSTRNT